MHFTGTVYEAILGVLLKIFSASDEMLAIGIPAFRIIGITMILSGMTIMMSGVFQAMNSSNRALYVSIVQAVTLVGSAALLSMTGSTTLAWLSFPISEIVIFILSLAFLNRVYKENSLTEESAEYSIVMNRWDRRKKDDAKNQVDHTITADCAT